MSDLPKIAIQLCTYDRYDEIKRTVEALQDNLKYPHDKISLYVCDDSSPGKYISKLKRLNLFHYWETSFISTPQNGGWGRNVNNGLKQIPEDYIFFLEDDYVLEYPLDLRIGVALLEKKPHLGMLRYRGSAGGHFVFHQFEADLSSFSKESSFVNQDDWFEGAKTVPWKVTYLQFDSGSPELYIYSHGPHLKRKNFHSIYGMYPEGLKLGETEEVFAHSVKHRMRTDPQNSAGIVILPEWVVMRWNHIGKSFQHTEMDK